jgi:hypothetical protein
MTLAILSDTELDEVTGGFRTTFVAKFSASHSFNTGGTSVGSLSSSVVTFAYANATGPGAFAYASNTAITSITVGSYGGLTV